MRERLHNQANQQTAAPAGGMETVYKDEAMVRLLETPEVQAGIEQVDAAITEYYRQLERDGNTVHPLFEGVAADGTRLVVAEYTDNPTSEQREGKYVRGAYPSFRERKYSVFAYPLQGVTQPGFAESIAPITQFDDALEHRGSGIKITFERPAGPIAMGESEQSSPYGKVHHRRASDHLHVPQVPSDMPRYNGQPIVSLEDARFGERRWARVKQEIAPLEAKQQQHLEAWAHAIGLDPEVAAREKAAADKLAERALATTLIMKSNPVMFDSPGIVHDKAKAEHIAHEVKGAMDKAATAKNEKGKAKQLAEAEKIAERAGAEYNAEPLEVFDKSDQPEAKGLFGRSRRH
jgi:hypothetical protein